MGIMISIVAIILLLCLLIIAGISLLCNVIGYIADKMETLFNNKKTIINN